MADAQSKRAAIELNRDELEILANALNEVCHGLDIEEFSIRMGASKPEVLRLLAKVSNAVDRLD